MGDSGNGLHLSGIILAALVLAAWMLQSPPLAPSRPSHGDQLQDRGNSFEDVPARLWQDPFDTVRRFRDAQQRGTQQVEATLAEKYAIRLQLGTNDTTDQAHGLAHLVNYVRQACEAQDPQATSPFEACEAKAPLTILPVMAATSPYAEVIEHRLRLRAAVVAGLASNGIAPMDGSHIGYWFEDRHPGPTGNEIPAAVMPYELYQGGGRTVLLLWLPVPHFAREPLPRLAALVKKLREERLLPNNGELSWGRFTLIGPPDSDTLGLMARDAEKWAARPDWSDSLSGVELFAATPTAPASSLLQTAQTETCPEKSADPEVQSACLEQQVVNSFKRHGMRLVRSIVTDERITKALVAELALRGVDPACHHNRAYPRPPCRDETDAASDSQYGGHRDHIVLISEADTSFGRSLPRLFNAEVLRRMSATEQRSFKDKDLPWIHRYGYLRGVDGELPNTEHTPDRGTPTDLENLSRIDQAALEPATGTSQFDYLRRLALRIRTLDQRLRDNGKGRIRAIGILGNDVYDKLLILQAMRVYFPNHLYFTNDLDARFLSPDDYRWTRNLVIASAFGLELDEDWQRMVAPSRGVYQTSVFLSTHLALRLDNTLRTSETLRTHLTPRIFEVGRGRFIDLGTMSDPVTPPGVLWDINGDPLPPLYPPPYSPALAPPQWPWIAGMGVLSLILLVLLISPLRARIWGRDNLKTLVTSLIVITGCGAILGYAYWCMTRQPEPFVWAAGVSMWPSALIYILCTMLSVLFLWMAVTRIGREEAQLADSFNLQDASAESDETVRKLCPTVPGKHGLARILRPLCDGINHLPRALRMLAWYDAPGRNDKAESIPVLWRTYRGHARPSHRFARTTAMFLLLWVIAWIALVFVQPMQIPYRGDSAYNFSFWFGMGPLALSFGLLLFWVMDETRVCSALVRHISTSEQDWPNVEKDIDEQLAREFSFSPGSMEEPPEEITDPMRSQRIRHDRLRRNVRREQMLRDNRIRLERKRRTVDFIARRTDPTGNMIWYPFIILILILISLSTRFDNYDTKTAVLGLLGAAIGIALSSAYVLRRTANRAKKDIVAQLRSELLSHKSMEAKTEPEQVEVLIQQIEEIHQGAFRPWYQEPLLRGLLWVGSMAAVIITEYITVSG